MINTQYQIPPSKTHLTFLDALRGVAIGAVFLFHLLGAAYGRFHLTWLGIFPNFKEPGTFKILSPLSLGFTGVAIFFVISGFCIHLSFESASPKTWNSFFIKRFFRIYPAYLLAVAFFFFGPIQMYTLNPETKWWELISHVLTIHNFGETTYFGINPSLWSVAVEVQLYLLYPVFRYLVKKFGWRNSLTILAVIELVIKTAILTSDFQLSGSLPRFVTASPLAYWFSWGLGAYVCETWQKGAYNPLGTINFYWVLVFAIASAFVRPLAPFTFTLVAFSTSVFITQHLQFNNNVRRSLPVEFPRKHLCFLGTISYSFYLFHQPFVATSHSILTNLFPNFFFPSFLILVIMLLWYPVILAISLLIYNCIEQPFIQLGKKIISKRYGAKFKQPVQLQTLKGKSP